MKNDKQVYIILVSYRNADLTIECVRSILSCNDPSIHIVIVDNNSPDDTFVTLKKELSGIHNVKLILSKANNGFSAGNNIGIKYSLKQGADYVMLLNNDTVIDPDMIDILKNKCDRYTVASPKMYYYDSPQRIWFAGGKYLKKSGRYIHIGENQMDSPEHSKSIRCDFLTGCCMMISSQTIRDVGLLSEEYFMYIEDIDYSLRLKKNHVRMIMIPDAKLWHKIGASSGNRSKLSLYYGNRNRLYLNKKFHKSFYIKTVTVFSRILLALKGSVKNTDEKIIWLSLLDYLKGNMGKRILSDK